MPDSPLADKSGQKPYVERKVAPVNMESRNNRTRSEPKWRKSNNKNYVQKSKGDWVETESACLGTHGSLVSTIK